jgi:hypothetical protein
VTARGLRAVSAAALVASMVLAPAAHAHSWLVKSEPRAGATLAQPPAEVVLVFAEAVEPAFVKIAVHRDGKPVQPAPVPVLAADAKSATVPLGAAAGPGAWSIDWRIVARDGHRSNGTLRFVVKPR